MPPATAGYGLACPVAAPLRRRAAFADSTCWKYPKPPATTTGLPRYSLPGQELARLALRIKLHASIDQNNTNWHLLTQLTATMPEMEQLVKAQLKYCW